MNIHVARTPHFRTRFTHTCCQGQTGSLTVRPDTARCTTWFACYIPHCCTCTGVVCNAEHFNYYLVQRQSYLHQYLLSSITTLGAEELRHLTGMNMLYFTPHTFCFNGGRFGHLIKQVLSPIDMWLALIRCSSCR